MKNITVIDGKQFINDYIEFKKERHWARDEAGKLQCLAYNFPTTKCFVHVWQKCDSMKEFWTYLTKLHCVISPNSECSLLFVKGRFRQRAYQLIKKGVKLKSYPRDGGWSPQKEKEINELNELAALSLN